jgi:hypothetical protein
MGSKYDYTQLWTSKSNPIWLCMSDYNVNFLGVGSKIRSIVSCYAHDRFFS